VVQDLSAHVLCVDDDPTVLEGLSALLRRRYQVHIATSGPVGLATLEQEPGIVVVISDLEMPGMNGIRFLQQVRERDPDIGRILFTGKADIHSAVEAVNNGQIFRFLIKPCSGGPVLDAVAAAITHHRLVTGERVLLEQTLRGSITVLAEVLSLTNPTSFGRANRIKQLVLDVAEQLQLTDRWQLEVAAMFSQLGFITLPPQTAERVYFGQPLTENEHRMVERVPAVTEGLLANIPRLEGVRSILALAAESQPPSLKRPPADPVIRASAALLRAALEFDSHGARGTTPDRAIELMRAHRRYPAEVLDGLALVRAGDGEREQIHELGLARVMVGMILADDIVMADGTLLAARGYRVGQSFVERAENLGIGAVREPIRVFIRGSEDDPARLAAASPLELPNAGS
jgi:FixJ family two-component response regulator